MDSGTVKIEWLDGPDIIKYRACTVCKDVLPVTEEYFSKRDNSLRRSCKICENSQRKKYREDNRDRLRIKNKILYNKNGKTYNLNKSEKRKETRKNRVIVEVLQLLGDDGLPCKICYLCKKTLPATNEYFHKNSRAKDKLGSYCKICQASTLRVWIQNNRELVRERQAAYDQNNKTRKKLWRNGYYLNNTEKILARSRKWLINNPEKIKKSKKLSRHKRDTLIKNLPFTLTQEHIENLYKYFNSSCAICGSAKNLHLDHWTPLSHPLCKGAIPTNIMLLCAKCNLSKNKKLPEHWLRSKFTESIVQHIISTVNAYFQEVA